jgi:hypothetical protein
MRYNFFVGYKNSIQFFGPIFIAFGMPRIGPIFIALAMPPSVDRWGVSTDHLIDELF